jgi:predicted O-methyltransferase YrrM
MNLLGMVHSDASWWQAHMALPRIVAEQIGNPRSGVEVGVAFGSMSVWLARLLPSVQIIAVDPFVAYDATDGMSDCMAAGGDAIASFVRWRFGNEKHGRLSLWRMTSREAASAVADASQDFVFIDADHRYEAACEDIAIWRPKVRPGGLLCGHDYCDSWPGVVRAVQESFAAGVERHDESTIWYTRV